MSEERKPVRLKTAVLTTDICENRYNLAVADLMKLLGIPFQTLGRTFIRYCHITVGLSYI